MKRRTLAIITSLLCVAFVLARARHFAARHAGEYTRTDKASVKHPNQSPNAPDSLEFLRQLVRNSPFSATLLVESTVRQPDGATSTKTTTSLLYRDKKGRTRSDRFGEQQVDPAALESVTPHSSVINDPVAGFTYTLDHAHTSARRSAFVYQPKETAGESAGQTQATSARQHFLPMPASSGGENNGLSAGTAAGSSAAKTESLGTREIEGVLAEGTRVTMTLPAGAHGNEHPIQYVSERWYSLALQTVVLLKRSDPQGGETTYRLININLGEPSTSLFTMPANYKVRDENGREISQLGASTP
jgi:hypothetical protein